MAKYFVCGAAGSGKSSVVLELQKRGFTAYDTDSYPSASQFTDVNGNLAEWPSGYIDWEKYRWSWVPETIETLLQSNDPVFLGGVSSNQEDFYQKFKKIFVLCLDDKTLKSRILNRTSKEYGKDLKQLEGEIAYRATREAELLTQSHAVRIDALVPLKKVVDGILAEL